LLKQEYGRVLIEINSNVFGSKKNVLDWEEEVKQYIGSSYKENIIFGS
jgi:hypothetical protein